jgi:predicted O-methyltransferase YrrM
MGAEKKFLMYSRLQIFWKYLHYYLTAKNGKGHGVHSPFVYEFIRDVLNDRRRPPIWGRIEALRARLVKDGDWLEVEDLGAGSHVNNSRRRQVGEIARHAAKPAKLGQLLFRIASHYRCRRIVELGTSLGISTAYLAGGSVNGEAAEQQRTVGDEDIGRTGPDGVRLWTIEGAPAVAAVAARNFRELGLEHVELVVGNFDERLKEVLDRAGRVDLAFVDGNHRLEPTMRYFHALMERCGPESILIFDDVHWSEEMEEAWERIQRDPRVYMTIDLFFIGLVVLRDEFKVKQRFVIRF